MSFLSSNFKLIIKRFGKILVKKTIFRPKKCVLIFRPKNHFQTNFIFFSLFLTFLIDFQSLFSLAVLVVSQQVLNDLNRFGRVQSKTVFYVEHFVLAAWS